MTLMLFAAGLAVLIADYSHACDLQKLGECSQKYLDLVTSARPENYLQLMCRSDVKGYVSCIFEEGKACGTISQYISSLHYSSVTELEKYCASNGQPISKNAAEQTLPTAVIIVGLLTVLLVRTFPF